MTRGWEPGTQYNLGDRVEYQHHEYKIIQPHFSQSDWTPDRTPALWGMIPAHECGDGGQQQHHQQHQQQPPQYQGGDSWENKTKQQVPISHEERQTGWGGLSPERKKELEVGGGLALGLGLLGAGFAAYKHHEHSEEEKKAIVWGAQNWLHDAQARTERFYREGPTAPVTWVLVHGKQIPEDQAIQGGEANSCPIYIARAFHDGGVQVGKCSREFTQGAVVGYGHKEIAFDTYEVLVGDSRAIRWVDVRGKLKLQELGVRPVEAGRESNGTPLYIAQAPHHGGTHCGKVSEKLDCAFIAADGKEVEVDDYRILCYV